MRIEDEAGNLQKVVSVSGEDWLKADIATPGMIFDGLFEDGATTQVVVAPGADVRRLVVNMVCAIAAGVECLGHFAPTRPRKVWYLSGSAAADDEQNRFRQHLGSMAAGVPALVAKNLMIYQRAYHGELVPLGIEDADTRAAVYGSMPEGTECIVIDDIASLIDRRHLSNADFKAIREWIKGFAREGIPVIFFLHTASVQPQDEAEARNTIYVEADPGAPSQFGGGWIVHRSRQGDADHTPKSVACWWTWIGGQFEWTYHLPDLNGSDLRSMKRWEFDLKVAMMKIHGASGREIALILETNEAAVSRAKSRFTQMEAVALAALRSKPEESEAMQVLIAERRAKRPALSQAKPEP